MCATYAFWLAQISKMVMRVGLSFSATAYNVSTPGSFRTEVSISSLRNELQLSSCAESITSFVIDPVSPPAGGAVRESVDDIKFGAAAQFTTQNRLVTVKDYESYLKKNYLNKKKDLQVRCLKIKLQSMLIQLTQLSLIEKNKHKNKSLNLLKFIL